MGNLGKKRRFSRKLQLKNAKYLRGIFIVTIIFGKDEGVKKRLTESFKIETLKIEKKWCLEIWE